MPRKVRAAYRTHLRFEADIPKVNGVGSIDYQIINYLNTLHETHGVMAVKEFILGAVRSSYLGVERHSPLIQPELLISQAPLVNQSKQAGAVNSPRSQHTAPKVEVTEPAAAIVDEEDSAENDDLAPKLF